MRLHEKAPAKKSYTTPKMTVLGPLEEMTQQRIKDFGLEDGYTFQGTPIGDVSS